MEILRIKNFSVAGLSIRTNNASEMNPGIAQIGKLWERFYSSYSSHFSSDSIFYGVYYNYESDYSGDFSVMAAALELLDFQGEETEILLIEEGDYLVFKGSGPMPQTIIDVWSGIWSYFSSSDEYERLYKTDFEVYKGPSEVEVYIGVKSP